MKKRAPAKIRQEIDEVLAQRPSKLRAATVIVYSRPSGYWYAQAHDATTGAKITEVTGHSRAEALRELRGKFAMIGVAIKSITEEDPYDKTLSEKTSIDPSEGGDTTAAEIASAKETSERRIAALVADGEDVRNTPAWRDAVHESQMIGLKSRLMALGPQTRRRTGIGRSGHTRVDIRWYALPNQNKAAGGFLPMIEEDGKARGDAWRSHGYTKTEAEAMAEERAREAASRFVGDWHIVMKKGRPPQP